MKSLVFIAIAIWSYGAYCCSLEDTIAGVSDITVHTLEDGREILADEKTGLTLYTFDVDEPGVSKCFDRCLKVWPVIATEQEHLPLPFSIHIREDGTRQIVFKDSPLYFYRKDKEPGDILGDGVGEVWHLVDINAVEE